MRSRYCAYALGLTDYLLETWHPSTRPPALEPDDTAHRWLRLDVRRHAVHDDTHASVEFVAVGKQGGRAHRLHEVSRFVREGGCWYYLDAEG
jgi:SEC-C motif domain protein